MIHVADYPGLVFVLSFGALWISTQIGARLLRRQQILDDKVRVHFDVILAATLTLLGLIIGFTFSMAISRYDQRKNLEEAEANAIGTEYVRADLLPPADAAKVRSLLRNYLDQRILYYSTRDAHESTRINARTLQLQGELWTAVLAPATAQPTPIVALAVGGMNDVFNSQGYTQAAWWNRIPIAAWCLMAVIAACCCMLLGYSARNVGAGSRLHAIIPFVVSVSVFLIADIDSPNGGIIRVSPQNLLSLAQSMGAR